MCNDNCVCALDCLTCCIRNETRTNITDLIAGFIITAVIDISFEFIFNKSSQEQTNEWLYHAIRSSGITAVALVLLSMVLKMANYKWGTQDNERQRRNHSYFCIALTLAELFSGALAFGFNFGVEMAIEKKIGHQTVNDWKKSDKIAISILAPAGVALAKTISRFGVFALSKLMIEKCCTNKDETTQSLNQLQRINYTV